MTKDSRLTLALASLSIIALTACSAGHQQEVKTPAAQSVPSESPAPGAGEGVLGGSIDEAVVDSLSGLAPPPDAQLTASGLASVVVAPGVAPGHPGPRDIVTVHYSGWTLDGKLFDSSRGGEPLSFPLDKVIPGWTEGVQLMVDGEKRRFWIPADLAYGDSPMGGRPAGMLVFDIELISHKAQPTVEAPADVAAAPKHAMKTETGLAYVILKPGTGVERPTSSSTVTVHYSGWTTDGKLFDSSVLRGQTVSFPLRSVIPGWMEGVQLMNVGSKFRFWIPGHMAYGDEPAQGRPHGTLVFDVELFAIE